MHTCIHCSTTDGLRPYGPNGAMVCFPCAMETPERKKQAEDAFNSQLDAAINAGNGMVTVGTEAGPLPLSGRLQ